MKKKLLSKKGSTMVMLVVAIGVISILGTSVLGVTMMNYKIKKVNSDIKQSFYLSESGLDKAYVNAYNFVATAVDVSNTEAKNFVEQFTPEKLYEWPIDSPYIDFYTDIEGNIIYSYDEVEIQKAAKLKFEDKYREIILKPGDSIVEKLEEPSESNPDEELIVNVTNEDPLEFVDKKMTVKIESEYTSKDITRTTAVNLVVEVPKYNESYTVTTKLIPVNPFWTKVIAAENLSIESDSEFDGEVYVSNNLSVDGNSLFMKNLAVKGDISINGNNELTTNDVFASNINMEGVGAEFATSAGTNVHVRDDLEIKNKNQKVNINGSYYGFSDGRDSTTPDNSSGINVNETDGLILNITDKLYLFGTSYVNVVNSAGKKYQTGESLSVKGNFRAYLQPLYSPDISKLSNMNFVDYQYLRFADSFADGSTFSAMDKADYIRNYQDEYGGLSVPLGIDINASKTVSLGSTMDTWSFKGSTYTIGDNIEFSNAKDRFEKQTERLGYDVGNMLFSDQVKLSNLPTNIIDETNSLNYIYINKGTDTKTLTAENYKGLIITNGNIVISDSVKSFEGAIIAGGTVTIEGNLNDKTFTYNRDIISKIIDEENLHTTVFAGSASVGTVTRLTFESDENAGKNVDFSSLLKFNSWKIK